MKKILIVLSSKGPPAPQKLKGGEGDNLTPAEVDPAEFAMGMKVEREHTEDPKVAKEIVMDHLAEDPKYYTKLAKIEKE